MSFARCIAVFAALRCVWPVFLPGRLPACSFAARPPQTCPRGSPTRSAMSAGGRPRGSAATTAFDHVDTPSLLSRPTLGERRPTGTEPRTTTQPARWAVRSTRWCGSAPTPGVTPLALSPGSRPHRRCSPDAIRTIRSMTTWSFPRPPSLPRPRVPLVPTLHNDHEVLPNRPDRLSAMSGVHVLECRGM